MIWCRAHLPKQKCKPSSSKATRLSPPPTLALTHSLGPPVRSPPTAGRRAPHSHRKPMAAPIGHAQLSGSTVPQHSTFAHSKEDVLNALAFYFGQPASPEKLKDYNEHHAATYRTRTRPSPATHLLPSPTHNHSLTTPSVCHRFCRFPRRVRRLQQSDPRHHQQPHREVAAELAHGERSPR